MKKNYSDNKTSQETLPRKIVINRILAFSKSYQDNKKDKNLDLLKN